MTSDNRNRIDIFMPTRSQYGVLHYFTEELYKALVRAGVPCHLQTLQQEDINVFLEQIFKDPPLFTLTFNGILPDDNGIFLADLIRIPHVCCLVDSSTRFISVAQSKYTIITCVDRVACEFLKKIHHENTFFLPHAASKDLSFSGSEKRPYEVLVLASCIDYEAIAELWRAKYPKELVDTILDAADRVLLDQNTSFIDALNLSIFELYKINPGFETSKFNFIKILDELENYVIGFDRVRVIRSIRDARIDIFGQSKEMWEKMLGQQPNCVFHDPVSFREAFELLKQTKILLNSCIAIKGGGHERIYSGMALGAIVFTSENDYMKETFMDGENVIFYTAQTLDDLNSKVIDILANENKRAEIAQAGHDVVKKHHTWDHRAASLLEQLPAFLAKFLEV
ncbi:MAG: glycosyltransferase family 1 protein [Parachlamydiaceae bacterium]|nr:glycosyltransferase family 1 protein [Parachlamydiaceae bacterium]